MRLPWRDRVRAAQEGQRSRLRDHSLWLLWLPWGQRVPVNEQKGSAQERAQDWSDNVKSPGAAQRQRLDTRLDGKEETGYLRAGQEALQDRWGQMLLGYPRTAKGEVGSLNPSTPQTSSCPHPTPTSLSHILYPPSLPSVRVSPEGQEGPGHLSRLALPSAQSVR